jgi:hypothetical protein
MGKFNVIQPITITEAMLIDSDVPEADHAEWVVDTAYDLGDQVIRASLHKVYESLSANNLGNAPEASPTQWVEVCATNRWAMFDGSVSRSTAQQNTISLTIRPGVPVNALAVINAQNCTEIRVRIQDGTFGTLFDQTYPLSSLLVLPGWWEWFFGARNPRTQLVIPSLPHIPTADILVDFTGGVDLSVGVLAIGTRHEFGFSVRPGARFSIQDFSRKETNDFGDTALARRAYARRAEYEILIWRAEVDSVLSLLADLRAVPCLWSGSASYEAATVYGFYKGGEVLIAYYNHSVVSLDIEGLT